MTLSLTELDTSEAACRAVPLTESTYAAEDLVQTLLETVVDYRHHTTKVVNAVTYFKEQKVAGKEATVWLALAAHRMGITERVLDWSVWAHEQALQASPFGVINASGS